MQIQIPIVLCRILASHHHSIRYCSHSSWSWQTTCPFHTELLQWTRILFLVHQLFIRRRETRRRAHNTMGTLNTAGLRTCMAHENVPTKRRRYAEKDSEDAERETEAGREEEAEWFEAKNYEKMENAYGVILLSKGRAVNRATHMMAAAMHSSWANWKLVHFTAINTPEEMRNEEGVSNAARTKRMNA